MDTLLIGVTVVSLAIACAMSLVVLKLLREDRRRSEARIAALLEAAAARDSQPPRAACTAGVAQASQAPRKPAPRPRAADRTGDLPLRVAPPTQELFVEPEPRPSWGPRMALAAGVLAVLLGLGLTLLGPGGATVPGSAAASSAGVAAAAPLELLTLQHTAGADSLTVSGLVQNPRGGSAKRRVAAVVFALDARGEVLATNRAPIDVTTIEPGEESPFVVSVPVRGAARYRVGFRAENGEVIAHVDRRTGGDAVAHR